MKAFDTKHAADHGYTKADWDEVADNPKWTKKDFENAKPFADAFPDLAESARRTRGTQKAPTKKLVSLRLSEPVLAHFRATGPGWQTRIDEALKKAAGLG